MKGIFLYGGCVTRDSFEYLRSDYRLVKYVARQSLISAGHAPLSVTGGESELASKFQQEQLRGDIESSFFPALRAKAADSDAIILDLVVERLGVRKYQQGFLTRSNELAKSTLGKSLTPKNESIRFSTRGHFRLWSHSARRLVKVLHHAGALDRTIVFDTPWASHTSSGAATPSFRGRSSDEMNLLFRPYYEYLKEVGLRVEKLPDDRVVGDDEHQWGVAPYHYIPAAYGWMADVVRGIPDRSLPDRHAGSPYSALEIP